MENELVQHIIHDLKNPLTILIGGLHLLKEGNLGPVSQQQEAYIKNLELSGQDILQMVDDFLDVERLENGTISLYRLPTNVENLVQRCVDYWRPHAVAYHLDLHCECAGNMPSIPVDQRLMRRVLLNLLKNCVRYTPENGRILVQTAVAADGVTIVIADSGTVVPTSQREMVFAKHARIDGGTNRDIGLGLPFSKLVAEAHGGQLSLEESTLGGMQFVLALPFSLAANGINQQQDGLTAVYTGRVVT